MRLLNKKIKFYTLFFLLLFGAILYCLFIFLKNSKTQIAQDIRFVESILKANIEKNKNYLINVPRNLLSPFVKSVSYPSHFSCKIYLSEKEELFRLNKKIKDYFLKRNFKLIEENLGNSKGNLFLRKDKNFIWVQIRWQMKDGKIHYLFLYDLPQNSILRNNILTKIQNCFSLGKCDFSEYKIIEKNDLNKFKQTLEKTKNKGINIQIEIFFLQKNTVWLKGIVTASLVKNKNYPSLGFPFLAKISKSSSIKIISTLQDIDFGLTCKDLAERNIPVEFFKEIKKEKDDMCLLDFASGGRISYEKYLKKKISP